MYLVPVIKIIIISVQVVNVLLTSLIAHLLKLVVQIFLNVQMDHVLVMLKTVFLKFVNLVNIFVGMVDAYLIQLYAQQEVLVLMNIQLNAQMVLVK